MKSKLLFSSEERPHALAGTTAGLTNDVLYTRYPKNEHANILWNIFMDRVEVFLRICFRWWLKDFRARSLDAEKIQQLSGPEHALLSALYLVAIVSMSDEECRSSLRQSRTTLISEYQLVCEDALLRMNLFCMSDIVAIKAVIFYVVRVPKRRTTPG